MVLATLAFVAGTAASLMASNNAKKLAAKQAALAQREAARIRARAAESRAAMSRELEGIRTLRSLDVPAFTLAAKQGFLNASKAAERVARVRTTGRLGNEVRSALFGGQFDQYVGRTLETFQRYTDLTQRLFEGSKAIQAQAVQAEVSASQLSFSGQSAAIQMDLATGDPAANILGTTAQVLSQLSSAKSTKDANATKSADSFFQQSLFNDNPLGNKAELDSFMKKQGFADYTPQQFYDTFFGGKG